MCYKYIPVDYENCIDRENSTHAALQRTEVTG